MKNLSIEFFGDAGRVHNVRFVGEAFASNEVILGLFYEDVEDLLKDLDRALVGTNILDYDFGDFISGSISKHHVTIKPDNNRIKSKSYKVKTNELKETLEKWKKFKARNRNGVVKAVKISAEIY